MSDDSTSFWATTYYEYSMSNPDAWGFLLNQVVVHNCSTRGTIVALLQRVNSTPILTVEFEQPVNRKSRASYGVRSFEAGTFVEVIVRPNAEIPVNVWEGLVTLEKLARQKERELRLAQEEDQRREEAEMESKRDFARLRAKFHATTYPDASPLSPLYMMLLEMEANRQLSKEHLTWLEESAVFGPIAIHHQRESDRVPAVRKLLTVSKYWRKARQSSKALEASHRAEALLDPRDPDWANLKSSVLTTRGGALRDMGNLDAAEKCGKDAIDLNDLSYYPYSLLGAIAYERGSPQQGDSYFAAALKRGAPADQTTAIKSAIKRAGPVEQRAIAEYLLKKDPQKYSWAKRYL